MSESITVGINRLSLKPGDILVVTVADHIVVDADKAQHIEDTFRRLCNNKVIIAQGMSFSVLRNDVEVKPELASEIDEPIAVEVKT